MLSYKPFIQLFAETARKEEQRRENMKTFLSLVKSQRESPLRRRIRRQAAEIEKYRTR